MVPDSSSPPPLLEPLLFLDAQPDRFQVRGPPLEHGLQAAGAGQHAVRRTDRLRARAVPATPRAAVAQGGGVGQGGGLLVAQLRRLPGLYQASSGCSMARPSAMIALTMPSIFSPLLPLDGKRSPATL